MIEIPIAGGFVALVDDEDRDAVIAAGPWTRGKPSTAGVHYAQRNLHVGATRTTQSMHSFLTGWPLTDHVNGDGLDNRRANLRPATHAENLRNRGPQRNNASGFKGVSRRRGALSNPWVAAVTVERERHYLGVFPTAEAAARAYDAAAIRLHGEFARLNFPVGVAS